ncbi:MAG TPA: glycosyltransferase family 4 protein [Motilibacteraceae bacterium]|nr:glycosyltransferase family 4 protein [Motilibacteraceae bacterium]
MRVLQLVGSSTGGIGRHVRALAAGLAGRNVEVVVAAPALTAASAGLRELPGVRLADVEIADRPRPRADLRAARRIRSLAGGCEVVHAHGVRAGALAALALGTLRHRPRLVVTVHNAPPSGGAAARIHRLLERLVAARADAVLAVSPDLVDRFGALGARRVALALVPAPAQGAPRPGAKGLVRAALGVAADAALVVVVARLAAQKGLPVLLDAAARLAGDRPGLLAVVAGEGPLRGDLQRRIDAEHLPVRLLGPRGDVSDLLAAADVVAVPSRWEGQSLAVQEALRAGAPLVATAAGGTPWLVGDAAVLVPPGDPDALAGAVAGLLEDEGRRAGLREAARRRAAQLPTEEDAVSQVLTVYRERLG